MTEPTTGMFSGITLPFTPTELAAAGMELISLVGPFVLLAMAFLFAPKVIAMLKQAFGSSKA